MGKSGLRLPTAILYGLKLARGRFSGVPIRRDFCRLLRAAFCVPAFAAP